MKRTGLILLFIARAAMNLEAQEFGGFPPSVKWQQINTDSVRIIFPVAVDSQAQQIAGIIHKIAKERPQALGSTLRKVNIILHNNTTMANGYVALAPFRSEYYLVPGSDMFEFGANPWYEELAVHEFRHVQQFSNFNKGISKLGSVILGQQGQAFFNALSIPDWFWEGDAVHAETELTPQGRGRTPFFFNGYKSLWSEGRNYSWMKLRSGSLKDFVPNHYDLGYLLVNYGYLKYGDDFWKNVTSDAAAFKGLMYPFQKAVKKYSGTGYKTFRKQALTFYSEQVPKKSPVKRATVTNVYYPQYIGQDSLLYVKSSYNALPAFYLKNASGEHRLRLRNITTEDWFSYRDGMIAYTAYEPDTRWSLVDYSSVYLYDIRTGDQRKITSKGKYYTPDIAPSGKRVVTVLINNKTQTELRVMSILGQTLQTIQPENHAFFSEPRFVDENTVAVVERLPNSTVQLVSINLENGSRTVLIPATRALIGQVYSHKGFIYFISSLKGTDAIYALRLSDKKIFELESGVTGSYYPSVFNNKLVWSAFTSNGLAIREKPLTETPVPALDVARWQEVNWPYPVAGSGNASNVLAGLSRRFPVTSYKQGAHLFNFHSWRPGYNDPEFTFRIFSDNILNTFTNEIYYRYNQNETSHAVGFNTSYGGFFPVINAGVEYTFNRTFRDTSRTIDLNQLDARFGYNIPLNFTGGRMYRFLNFGSDYVFNHTSIAGVKSDSLRDHYQYLRHFVSWVHYLPMARQHIYPKFGYTLGASYRHLLDRKGFQLLGNTQLFLPSFGNHSIVLSASWQETDTNNVIFSNRFAASRGFDDYYFSRMWRLSANYHFPIAYPDFGFANIIFLQRLRGNAFFDFTKVYSKSKKANANLRSTGAEIYFDTKVWNELPVTIGVRLSHLLDDGYSSSDKKGSTWVEIILPMNLVPQ